MKAGANKVSFLEDSTNLGRSNLGHSFQSTASSLRALEAAKDSKYNRRYFKAKKTETSTYSFEFQDRYDKLVQNNGQIINIAQKAARISTNHGQLSDNINSFLRLEIIETLDSESQTRSVLTNILREYKRKIEELSQIRTVVSRLDDRDYAWEAELKAEASNDTSSQGDEKEADLSAINDTSVAGIIAGFEDVSFDQSVNNQSFSQEEEKSVGRETAFGLDDVSEMVNRTDIACSTKTYLNGVIDDQIIFESSNLFEEILEAVDKSIESEKNTIDGTEMKILTIRGKIAEEEKAKAKAKESAAKGSTEDIAVTKTDDLIKAENQLLATIVGTLKSQKTKTNKTSAKAGIEMTAAAVVEIGSDFSSTPKKKSLEDVIGMSSPGSVAIASPDFKSQKNPEEPVLDEKKLLNKYVVSKKSANKESAGTNEIYTEAFSQINLKNDNENLRLLIKQFSGSVAAQTLKIVKYEEENLGEGNMVRKLISSNSDVGLDAMKLFGEMNKSLSQKDRDYPRELREAEQKFARQNDVIEAVKEFSPPEHGYVDASHKVFASALLGNNDVLRYNIGTDRPYTENGALQKAHISAYTSMVVSAVSSFPPLARIDSLLSNLLDRLNLALNDDQQLDPYKVIPDPDILECELDKNRRFTVSGLKLYPAIILEQEVDQIEELLRVNNFRVIGNNVAALVDAYLRVNNATEYGTLEHFHKVPLRIAEESELTDYEQPFEEGTSSHFLEKINKICGNVQCYNKIKETIGVVDSSEPTNLEKIKNYKKALEFVKESLTKEEEIIFTYGDKGVTFENNNKMKEEYFKHVNNLCDLSERAFLFRLEEEQEKRRKRAEVTGNIEPSPAVKTPEEVLTNILERHFRVIGVVSGSFLFEMNNIDPDFIRDISTRFLDKLCEQKKFAEILLPGTEEEVSKGKEALVQSMSNILSARKYDMAQVCLEKEYNKIQIFAAAFYEEYDREIDKEEAVAEKESTADAIEGNTTEETTQASSSPQISLEGDNSLSTSTTPSPVGSDSEPKSTPSTTEAATIKPQGSQQEK